MGTQPGTAADAPPAATVDLADHGFSRVASGPSPFIDAAAFLLISGGMNVPEEYLAVFDATRPAFHGKDHVQRPLMLVMGGNDMISDASGDLPADGTPPFNPAEAQWMNPITKAYGLNDAPAYGVVIDGANHITPVSQFKGFSSAQCGVLWTDVIYPILENFGMSGTKILTDKEDTTSDEDTYLKDNLFADLAIRWLEGKFPEDLAVQEQEEPPRLDAFAEYSANFWDTYLTPEYDEVNSGEAKAFLNDPDATHMLRSTVRDTVGFRHSSSGAFVIRDASGADLVQFQNDGHLLVLKGTVTTGANISATSAKEFIIRDTTGTIAAKVDSTTGNLYLKGPITQGITDLRTTSNPEFVVRDAAEISQVGNADKARIILDTNGNLKLFGIDRPLP